MFKGTILLCAALAVGFTPIASAQLSSTDKAFVTKLAKSNNYELQVAQMAQDTSQNSSYKDYAQMIAADHTKAGQDLTAAVSAADPSIQLPTDISATDQAHLDTLKNAGNSFDVKYRAQMISTHVAAIKLVQNYVAQPNDNSQVKQFAQGLLPIFRKHLRDARKLPNQ
jgi:putative membrane protein